MESISIADAIERLAEARGARGQIVTGVVTGVTAGRAAVRRIGATVAEEDVPLVRSGLPAIGERAALVDIGGVTVVIGVLAVGSPAVVRAAAGSSASTAGQTGGNDRNGVIELIPGGSGIAAGQQLTVTFANPRADANFSVLLWPLTTAARTAGMAVGPTGRSTTGWSLTSDIALSSGSTYRWSYAVEGY